MRFGILILLVVLACGFIFWKDIRGMVKGKQEITMASNDDKGHSAKNMSGVAVTEKWDLPEPLREVSGIAYMDESRFACVQDEEGSIFIYNRDNNKIEKQIDFAPNGDYEGITLVGDIAYIVRADGKLFEVNLRGDQPNVKQYQTNLTAEHNVEALCYDKKNNRLLLGIKDDEPGNKNYKGIYAFDLLSKTMAPDPVIKIDVQHDMLKSGKKEGKTIKPSAMGIHPVSGELYITDGPKSRLLIMDQQGNIRQFLEMGKQFEQPEGISFSPKGEIFISNEGVKQPGNIMKVELEN